MAVASDEYGTVPAKPPLPDCRYLPFQFAGNQTSMPIDESLVGEDVICTRQNAGRSGIGADGVVAPGKVGGVNVPAAPR